MFSNIVVNTRFCSNPYSFHSELLKMFLRIVKVCMPVIALIYGTSLITFLAILLFPHQHVNFSFSCPPLLFLYSKDRAASTAGAAGQAGGHHREAWATRGPSYEDLYTQNVVINMDDQEDVHRASLEGKSAKERPIWLRESTVQGSYSSEEMKEGKRETSKDECL